MLHLRARLLIAMGLGAPLAGCPPAHEPTGTTVASDPVDASIPTASSSSNSIADPVDASVAPEAAALALVDAMVDASIVIQKKPKPLPQLPTTAFDVDYPMKTPPPHCKTGLATCVPQAWAIEKHGSAGDKKCPARIEVTCRCPPGIGGCMGGVDGISDAWACGAELLPSVTTVQRGAGKKDVCCYERERHCLPPGAGRLLRIDDEVIVARAAPRGDWLGDEAFDIPLPDDATRRTLAAHYRALAAAEHASIASFARTSLALLMHGAPPDLVADTHRAALDEIAHAKHAYAWAAAFGGAATGPAALSKLTEGTNDLDTLVALAVSTLRDACIPETIGAVLARECANATSPRSIRTTLTCIADDEARHAELAFRTLAWAVRSGGPETVRAVREALERSNLAFDAISEDAIPSYGVLGARTERDLAKTVFDEVVRPCVLALLSEPQGQGTA